MIFICYCERQIVITFEIGELYFDKYDLLQNRKNLTHINIMRWKHEITLKKDCVLQNVGRTNFILFFGLKLLHEYLQHKYYLKKLHDYIT